MQTSIVISNAVFVSKELTSKLAIPWLMCWVRIWSIKVIKERKTLTVKSFCVTSEKNGN